MKLPLHKSPAICTFETPAGPFVGTIVRTEISRVRDPRLDTWIKKLRKGKRWVFVIEFQGFNPDRAVCKTIKLKAEPSAEAMNAVGSKIHLARMRANALRARRQRLNSPPPVPRSIGLKALREVFPDRPLTEPEWLAYVAKEHGNNAAWHLVKDLPFDEAKKFFITKADRQRKRKKEIHWFLFAYWQRITREKMNARQAHDLATEILGQDAAGHLEAFQKHLQRLRVNLAPAHRVKSDKSDRKRRSVS